jgi:hypothetical protein
MEIVLMIQTIVTGKAEFFSPRDNLNNSSSRSRSRR